MNHRKTVKTGSEEKVVDLHKGLCHEQEKEASKYSGHVERACF